MMSATEVREFVNKLRATFSFLEVSLVLYLCGFVQLFVIHNDIDNDNNCNVFMWRVVGLSDNTWYAHSLMLEASILSFT